MEQYQFNPYKSPDNTSQKEHEMMLSNLRLILSRPEGKAFIKYLFKHFGFAEGPPIGMESSILYDMIGFNRAGESLFSIAAQADSTTTGIIMAEIQKEKYNV